jgi:Pyruvate/2-oxoacid:ferredoxin oxidoreductase gamma subunit
MKRMILSAVMFGFVAMFAGCDEKTKVEDKKTVETPSGKVVEKNTTEIKKTGDAKETAPASKP